MCGSDAMMKEMMEMSTTTIDVNSATLDKGVPSCWPGTHCDGLLSARGAESAEWSGAARAAGKK